MQNEQALIIASHGNQGIAELADGRQLACVYRRTVGRPVCGDQVMLDTGQGESNPVNEILPRKNNFVRGQRNGSKQIMAANLDQVVIVIAPEPAPSRDLLERYLVAVLSLGIKPLIVVNKAELLATEAADCPAPFNRLDEYRELGHQVITTSCKASPGITKLQPLLQDQISIVVGQSGVGKSSLVNALVPDLDLQTQTLSRSTGKGRHTTTSTLMYRLPGNGRLIDSPGVWEYGLWEMEQWELLSGYPEFNRAQGSCRFNNCRHVHEPDCAISVAVHAGLVPAWRLESYRRLLAQGMASPGR
ncbi:MAG: ribosome small subunit-dependent GTPase A [Xanthomonadales bacterium]|nr:ribosome small subunit-dependent GTPase A [Xanthomonadales bacterium]